ncbi:HdeD family acid-resistance protein, partial [Bacteroides ovatus]
WYMAFGMLAILCSLLILWQPAIGALYAVYMISFAFLIIGLFRVMLSFELKNLHKRK